MAIAWRPQASKIRQNTPPGRPGEFHPRAPTDPNVTVSRHSAPLTESSLTRPGPSLPTQILPRPAPWLLERTHPGEPVPSLHPHYRGFNTTTNRSASAGRNGTQCLTVSAARHAPSRTPNTTRVQYRLTPSHVPHRSRRPGSRHLHAGHHLARNTGTRQTHPEIVLSSRFRCQFSLSTRQQQSSS